MGNIISFDELVDSISEYWNQCTENETSVQEDNSVEQEDRLMALQGSSTYLAKFLDLDNRIVSKVEWITALENKRAEWVNDYDMSRDGPLTPINKRERKIELNNLVNLAFAQAMMRTNHLDTDFIISQREFTDSEGRKIFSSFWSGYVRDRVLGLLKDSKDDVFELDNKFLFIDIGTGELKFFSVDTDKSFNNFWSIDGQFGKMDGGVFQEMIENSMKLGKGGVSDISKSLRDYIKSISPGSESLRIYCAGSESMRKIQQSNPKRFSSLVKELERYDIYLEIVSSEEESKYEYSSFKYCLENAIDVDDLTSELSLVGNLAWGNGSLQGVHETHGYVSRSIGLKSLKREVHRIVGKDGGLKQLGLGSSIRIEKEDKKEILVVSDLNALGIVFESLDKFIDECL